MKNLVIILIVIFAIILGCLILNIAGRKSGEKIMVTELKGDLPRWLTEAGVPANKHKDCLKWAFGDDWSAYRVRDWVGLWNDRHGDLFEMVGTDDIKKSLKRIGRAYLKAKK